MRVQLKRRLAELQEELHKGETMMADLSDKQANLKESMLRIQGAIQVLKEELAKDLPLPVNKDSSHQQENGS